MSHESSEAIYPKKKKKLFNSFYKADIIYLGN